MWTVRDQLDKLNLIESELKQEILNMESKLQKLEEKYFAWTGTE